MWQCGNAIDDGHRGADVSSAILELNGAACRCRGDLRNQIGRLTDRCSRAGCHCGRGRRLRDDVDGGQCLTTRIQPTTTRIARRAVVALPVPRPKGLVLQERERILRRIERTRITICGTQLRLHRTTRGTGNHRHVDRGQPEGLPCPYLDSTVTVLARARAVTALVVRVSSLIVPRNTQMRTRAIRRTAVVDPNHRRSYTGQIRRSTCHDLSIHQRHPCRYIEVVLEPRPFTDTAACMPTRRHRHHVRLNPIGERRPRHHLLRCRHRHTRRMKHIRDINSQMFITIATQLEPDRVLHRGR